MGTARNGPVSSAAGMPLAVGGSHLLMTSVNLGPIALPLSGIFFLAGLATVMLFAWRPARQWGVQLERPLWIALLIGAVTARAAYVATHLPYFRERPVEALFFWQDGYLPAAGMAAALGTAWWLSRRARYPARHLLAPLLAGMAVWGGLQWIAGTLTRGNEPRLPDIALQSLAGEPVRLQAFADRPTVVNLWATWCPPCRHELPLLAAAQRNNPSVNFVFVNQGEGQAAVRDYLRGQSLTLSNVLLDADGQFSRRFGVRAIPTTLFFRTGGALADAHFGELSAARLSDYLQTRKFGMRHTD